MKKTASWKRICIGAVLGALFSVVVMVLPLGMWIKKVLFHLVINVGMLIIGLNIRDTITLIKSYASLYIISFLFGGVFSFLICNFRKTFQVGSLFMTITIFSYFFVRIAMRFLERMWRQSEKYCEVTLYYGTRKCRVKALIDTGNHLRDGKTGKAIHVGSAGMIERLIGEEKIKKIHYVPYRTIQKEQGILPVIEIDKMKIHGKEEREIFSPLLGISRRSNFEETEFEVILHPNDL